MIGEMSGGGLLWLPGVRPSYPTTRLWPPWPVVVHAEPIWDRTRLVCG